MSVKNSTILEKAWLEGSNDFQQRIPNPSISGYASAVNELFQPYNHDLYNQFANMLVGLMGTYVESKLFENPLRELKKPAAEFGNTERHVAVKYLQAHSTRVDDETLLKLEKPEFVEWFYSVSPGRRYEFSWSKYEMQRVFSNGDSYAFDDLLAATMTQMRSSDNYDEMNTMLQMFAEADARIGGLYRHSITAAPTTKELAQELLVKIKADAGIMQFPSTRYNHIDVPVFESTDTLVLWVTPEVDAYLDVMALAELFHVDRAEVNFRKIVIPEFPLSNVYAALTSEDFIYARDVWYGIEPPFYNNAQRTYKYYLFHDQMIGVNPAANCILYSVGDSTSIPTIGTLINDFNFSPSSYNCPIGGTVQLKYALTGTVLDASAAEPSEWTELSGSKISIQPQSATFKVSCLRSDAHDTVSVPLNSRTYVDDYGILHLQKSGINVGDEITVEADATYMDPSHAGDASFSAVATVTVTAAASQPAKDCAVSSDPYINYTNETEEATASE